MLTGAVLLLGNARLHAGKPLHALETVLLLVIMCLPAAMLWVSAPISFPILLVFFVWTALQVYTGAITGASGVARLPDVTQTVAGCDAVSTEYSKP